MGEVHLAWDRELERPVALKLLAVDGLGSQQLLRRFRREARAAGSINHPNVCTIYEVGQAQGYHFIAMEYVDGPTLREHIASRPMRVPEALDFAIQIAEALEAARSQNVVHRDIKSTNILLAGRSFVKITDFGLAAFVSTPKTHAEPRSSTPTTTPGAVVGTAAYLSPEQASGNRVDHRSDIFSLGVVVYEMLTGRLPFDGETLNQLLTAITTAEPPSLEHANPQVPQLLCQIVYRMLAKPVNQRYQRAIDVRNDLVEVEKAMCADPKQRRRAVIQEPAPSQQPKVPNDRRTPMPERNRVTGSLILKEVRRNFHEGQWAIGRKVCVPESYAVYLHSRDHAELAALAPTIVAECIRALEQECSSVGRVGPVRIPNAPAVQRTGDFQVQVLKDADLGVREGDVAILSRFLENGEEAVLTATGPITRPVGRPIGASPPRQEPATPSTGPCLKYSENGVERTFPLDRERTRIGRDPENELVVGDADPPVVSSFHAEIRRQAGSENFIIEDLNSVNGTAVGKDDLKPNTPRDLKHLDRISLAAGAVCLTFEART
jgi:serine/threonine protein kinase